MRQRLLRRGSGCLSGMEVALGLFYFRVGCERRRSTATGDVTANDQSQVVVKRAGMGLLVMDAELGKKVENNARLHFELACQLIDPNFHTVRH